MDSVTHGLFPYSLAAFLKRSRVECAAVLLGAIGPDFDIVFAWLGYLLQIQILSHRGITHSIFFGFFTAAILLYVFSRRSVAGFFKKALNTPVALEFNPRLLGFAYAGLLFHLLFDSLTSRGIPLLYPLTPKRFSAEIFFYIDFYLMALSGAILAYLYLNRKKIGDVRDIGNKLFVVYLVAFLLVGGLRLYEKNIAYGAFSATEKSVYATTSPFSWVVVTRGERIGIYGYDSAERNITYSKAVSRLNVNPEGASLPFERALAQAEKLPRVRDFELNARTVSVNAFFDKSSNEWVVEFSDPALGTEFSQYGGSRFYSVGARVSEEGAS